MKNDNFWKIFWLVIICFLLEGVLGVGWLKFSYLNRPDDTSRALAVGVTFDPNKDPFEGRTRERKILSLVSGYFYQDSLPLGLGDWSWDTEKNWRTDESVYEGSYSAKIRFLKPWSGVRLNNSSIDISSYDSLSLAVNPDRNIKDLYIELHDKYGNSMGKQSIAWYTKDSTLTSNSWNLVIIPLENLLGTSTKSTLEITGFSISSEQVGRIFIDSIHLEKNSFTHSKWQGSASSGSGTWIGDDPFTGTSQVDIPYSLDFTSENLKSWKKLFGQFEKVSGGIHIGPIPKKTNGSIVVFGGGKDWTDYREDAKVYWGMTSTFSLLARFKNDSNFVSCAYSNYGAVIQIYLVKNGISKLIGQTPGLAINYYEPWKDVKHAMEVKGNEVSCFMNNEKVLTADLPQMAKTGTVGFETWSFHSEDYPHKVLSFEVNPI